MKAASYVLFLLPALAASGCGGAQQSEAPPSSPAAAPATESSPPSGSVNLTSTPSQPPPPPPATVPSPAPGEPDARQKLDREAERRAAGADLDRAQRDLDAAAGACDSACRALASMERATAHLCFLAQGDEADDRRRCDDAKQRLTSAQSRVRSACGACR